MTRSVAIVLGLVIFLFDAFSQLEGAIAVLHVIVVLIAAHSGRKADLFVASGSVALLTIAAYLWVHASDPTGSSLVRISVSFAAIAIGTCLSYRSLTATRTLIAMNQALQSSEYRYRRMFATTRIGVLEEDWSGVQKFLSDLPTDPSSDLAQRLADCPALIEQAKRHAIIIAANPEAEKPLHPQYVARIIDELAADDAVCTVDVGTPSVWAARYLTMNGKRRILGSFRHGSMANAMPQALGAQAALPGRQVISMSGDGGFAMLMGDLLTAKQLKLPVKIVVFNNGSLGFVEMEMKAAGYLDTNVALENPDFAALAESAGVMGLKVSSSDQLVDALVRALAHDGPALLDVAIAKTELSLPPKIQLEQAKGFSLYMLKAIINGWGDEVLELATTNLFR